MGPLMRDAGRTRLPYRFSCIASAARPGRGEAVQQGALPLGPYPRRPNRAPSRPLPDSAARAGNTGTIGQPAGVLTMTASRVRPSCRRRPEPQKDPAPGKTADVSALPRRTSQVPPWGRCGREGQLRPHVVRRCRHGAELASVGVGPARHWCGRPDRVFRGERGWSLRLASRGTTSDRSCRRCRKSASAGTPEERSVRPPLR